MKLLIIFRSFIATVLFFVSTLFFSLLGLGNGILFNNHRNDDWIISTWARVACWLFGVEIILHGTQNIPQRGCVFLFNHSSFFDVFALAQTIPEVRFGAKIELFKIPFFGPAMRRAGTLPIARGNKEEVFKVYAEARGRIENNEKFALSPEGGRFFGPALFPFKAGPFVFAISSGAVISPVIIKGAYECLPKGAILANTQNWKSRIHVHFLAPISVESWTTETRQGLQKVVYEKMNDAYVQLPTTNS